MNSKLVVWSCSLAALFVIDGLHTAAGDGEIIGKQQVKHFEGNIDSGSETTKVKLDYLIYLPPGYGEGSKDWPLVMFLHGSGGVGNDVKRVLAIGPARIAEAKRFPFILVSPQSPQRGWNVKVLNALLDDVVSKHHVDKNRLYLTGQSMGGFGTWAFASAHPEKLAAIVPICGGGNPASAKKLKDLPIWVFHGAKDETVPPERSEQMVNALKEAGAKHVKFTLYPDAKHDSWTATYNNPEVWDWLLKQNRQSHQQSR
jgi:predicted peptidase